VSQFVVDASIVLAWCFPDEHSQAAQVVVERFKRGDTAIAPAFWPHEILNALLSAERRKRISTSLTQVFLRDVAALPVALEAINSDTVFDRTQLISRKHGLTAYDAAYLNLALEGGLPLATLDDDLIRAANQEKVVLVSYL